MDAERAIAVLENHNKWRRGGDIPMQEPKDIGEAVDIAVAVMKAQGWRPISEAPKDGAWMIGLDEFGDLVKFRWATARALADTHGELGDDQSWCDGCWDNGENLADPSCWMPLPPAPDA